MLLLPSLPLPPTLGTHLVSFGPRGPNVSLRGRGDGERLQGCVLGRRQHLPRDPPSWSTHCSPLGSPALRVPTLSPRSPRFPGKPCGREERGDQAGVQPGVQPGRGDIYHWPAIAFWPRASIFTLWEERHASRGSGMGAPPASLPWGCRCGISHPWGTAVRVQGDHGSTYPWPWVSTLASGSWQPSSRGTLPGKSKSLSLSLLPTAPAMSLPMRGDTPQTPHPQVPGTE